MRLLLPSISFLAVIIGNLAACEPLPEAEKSYLTSTSDQYGRPVYAVHPKTIEDVPEAYAQLVEVLKEQPTTLDNNPLVPCAKSHHIILQDQVDCDLLWLLQCNMHASWECYNGGCSIEVIIPVFEKKDEKGIVISQGVSLSVPGYPRAGHYASKEAILKNFNWTLIKLMGTAGSYSGGEWNSAKPEDYAELAARSSINIEDWYLFTRDSIPHNNTKDPDLITVLAKKFGLADSVKCVRTEGPNSKDGVHRRCLWIKKDALSAFQHIFKFNLYIPASLHLDPLLVAYHSM